MKKLVSSFLTFALTLSFAIVGLFATTAPAHAGDSPNIQICHATPSEKNPYTLATPSKTAIVNGTSQHSGDTDDIIPEFTYSLPGKDEILTFPAKNWTTANANIWAAGCTNPVRVDILNPNLTMSAMGTCINKNGIPGVDTQPAGVSYTISETVNAEGNWVVIFTKPENFITEEGIDQRYDWVAGFNPIQYITPTAPDSSDPNWDVEANACALVNTGASGFSTNALITAGGLIFAGLILFSITNLIGRRKS